MWELPTADAHTVSFRQYLGLEACSTNSVRLRQAAATNVVSFRIYGGDRFRLLAGPHLGFQTRWGADARRSYYVLPLGPFPIWFTRTYILFTLSVGISTGIDISFTRNTALIIEAGGSAVSTVSAVSRDVASSFTDARGFEGFLSVGCVYRFPGSAGYRAGFQLIE